MYAYQEDPCSNCKQYTYMLYDYSEGHVTCQVCGLVTERMIDQGVEYRQFSNENGSSGTDRQRLGAIRNELKEDGGMALAVNSSSSGRASSSLQKMNMRLGGQAEDVSLMKGQKLIQRWGSLLNLNKSTLNKAEEQFVKIENKMKSFKGKSVESIAAAVIFITSRICSIPLKPHDIEAVCEIGMEDINRTYHSIKEYADPIPSIHPSDYCSSFCAKLEIPYQISAIAFKIAEDIREKGYLDGKNPRSVAAVATQIALVETSMTKKYPLKEIAGVAEISEATIKKILREVGDKYKGKYAHN